MGVPFSWTPSFFGGTTPYTHSKPAGTLPAGLTQNTTTGTISGTPTTAGTSSGITLRVTDSAGTPVTADLTSVSFVVSNPLAITNSPGTTANTGSAYTYTPTTSGGRTAFVWSISNKPSWATFSTSTGVLTGTPSSAETDSAINITVVDADGRTTSTGTFTITVSAAPASIPRIMGALTPAGMGDIPITGSSIVSGNGSGHFQVTGGAIVGSAAGVAAGYNAGPYTLTTNDGQVFTITRVANAYSIGKQADFWDAGNNGVGQLMYFTSGILNGKRIIGRPGLTITARFDDSLGSPLRRTHFGDAGTGWAGVTVESEDLSDPWTFNDTSYIDITSRYMTFLGITFPPIPGPVNNAAVVLDGGATHPVTDIIFDRCKVIGPTRDVNSNAYAADATANSTWINGLGITTNGDVYTSNIRVIGCDIRFAMKGIVIPASAPIDADAGHLVPQQVHIAGNYGYACFETFCVTPPYDTAGLSAGTIVIEDNWWDTLVGLASDASAPHPDYYMARVSNTRTTDCFITYNRNLHTRNGRGAGSVSFRNMGTGGGVNYWIATCIGNMFAVGSSEGSLNIVDAKNSVALYNICLSHETNDIAQHGGITLGVGGTNGSGGGNRATGNVGDNLNFASGTTLSGNVEMGENEATIAFTSVFVGSSRPQTRAAMLSSLVTKGSYAAAGALGTAIPVNFPSANPSNILGSNNVS